MNLTSTALPVLPRSGSLYPHYPLLYSHLLLYYYICLLGPDWSWLKCTRWPLRLWLFLSFPNLCLPTHPLPVSLSHHLPFLSLSLFSCSVLRGWGQWRMAQVAMTTPAALTARMASMAAVNSCVSSSLCPLKMTPVLTTCSCFVGEKSVQWISERVSAGW